MFLHDTLGNYRRRYSVVAVMIFNKLYSHHSIAMQVFLLNDNKLGGTLPRQLGLMADLRWVHLSGNSLGGSIPDLILTLKDLTQLKLDHNLITGMLQRIIPDV